MGSGRLGIGLIGCGAFGYQRALGLKSIDNAGLVAAFDPDSDRALALAHSFAANAPASLDEFWAISEMDAVIIASPSDSHVEQTLSAARAGKHVLVEKPAALTLKDLQRMQIACDDAGVVLLVGQTLRYHSVAQGFYSSRQEGAIGEPVYFNWASGSNRQWAGGWRGWQTEYSRAGGITLHLAIHNIDLALWLLDSPPRRVYAQGVIAGVPGLNVPNVLQISVRCENDANALLEVHTNLPGPRAMFMSGRLIGTSGQSEWSVNDDGMTYGVAGARPWFPGYDQSNVDELRHFVDCCCGVATTLVTAEQSRHALAAGIAANRSISSGKAVDIDELLEEIA